MFAAALVIERDPLTWADLVPAIIYWVQSVGILAAICFILGSFIFVWRQKPGPLRVLVSLYSTALAVGLVAVVGVAIVRGLSTDPGGLVSLRAMHESIMLIVGALGLIGVFTPMARDLATRVSFGRIYALARLSFKEALRSRVVLLFAILALTLLFISWFIPSKPQYEVHSYVRFIFWSMGLVFLLAFTFLGAFSIPTDIKQQTIHTVATKPVERVEIVLGRWLGFGALMMLGLTLWTLLSYVYMARGISAEAREESFKARMPVFGALDFFPAGESVGREFEYRKYIHGPPGGVLPPGYQRHYAIYSFSKTPEPGDSAALPVEFTFDVFRLVKGEQGKGVECNFLFVREEPTIPDTIPNMEKRREVYRQNRNELVAKFSDPKELESYAIGQHGFWETTEEIKEYYTKSIQVPASFFRPAAREGAQQPTTSTKFKVYIYVSDRSRSQMVGFAPRDLYVLAGDRGFIQNFVKGIAGMALLFLLVMGVAIALSTYLSANVAWLGTLFLLLLALPLDFIKDLADGKSEGGGPMVSILRISKSQPLAAPIDDLPGAAVAEQFDRWYSFYLKGVLLVIPDIHRFNLTHYVGQGFDVPWGELLGPAVAIYWLGYLIPWLALAYYLLKFREIAIPT